MQFINGKLGQERNIENDDVYFDVGHRKWVIDKEDEAGNSIIYWPPKPYLTSTYAKKGRDPEDDWLVCLVQIKRWYGE